MGHFKHTAADHPESDVHQKGGKDSVQAHAHVCRAVPAEGEQDLPDDVTVHQPGARSQPAVAGDDHQHGARQHAALQARPEHAVRSDRGRRFGHPEALGQDQDSNDGRGPHEHVPHRVPAELLLDPVHTERRRQQDEQDHVRTLGGNDPAGGIDPRLGDVEPGHENEQRDEDQGRDQGRAAGHDEGRVVEALKAFLVSAVEGDADLANHALADELPDDCRQPHGDGHQ
ncbi:MAG: hypothetical protein ACYTGE_08080 [Planctomycetota bacterium]|jgi:hypothetical protein